MTEYGENGFVPTVESVSREGDALVFETIDPNQETDIISKQGEPLKRRADYMTDNQQDKLA